MCTCVAAATAWTAARRSLPSERGGSRHAAIASSALTILRRVAVLRSDEGQHERALRLAGAAAALGQGTGIAFKVFGERTADVHLATARCALGQRRAAAAWAAGETMGADEVVRYAVAPIEATGSPTAGVEVDSG